MGPRTRRANGGWEREVLGRTKETLQQWGGEGDRKGRARRVDPAGAGAMILRPHAARQGAPSAESARAPTAAVGTVCAPRRGGRCMPAAPQGGESRQPGPGWRNRQTRWTQNPVPARECEFDPRSGHHTTVRHPVEPDNPMVQLAPSPPVVTGGAGAGAVPPQTTANSLSSRRSGAHAPTAGRPSARNGSFPTTSATRAVGQSMT
jgi:hypothetical protein